MEELWHSLLKAIEPIVIPDWGALVNLLPIFLGLAIVLWIGSTARRFATIGPARRGRGRLLPRPPAGIHMPGPSGAPVLGALGVFLLFAGLVFGGLVLLVGVIALVVSLLGWLRDARLEYLKTEAADATGHLENIAAPATPARLLGIFGVLLIVAILFQTGILPPKTSPAGAGGGGASPAPSGGPPADVAATIVASGIAYDTKTIEVAAGKAFKVQFKNNDPSSVPHDIDVRQTDGKTVVQDHPTINGGQQTVYDFNALPAGSYVFICSVHPIPGMTGTLTAK
jgi:plastocyanin